MSLLTDKNGNYSFEITFHGQRHRKYCKTKNRQVAERLEREYRRKLELGQYDLVDLKQKQLLFRDAVVDYINRMKPKWKPTTLSMHMTSLPKVQAYFGGMVLNAIKASDIQRYQAEREANTINWWDGKEIKLRSGKKSRKQQPGKVPSKRTINTEVTLVRQLLVDHGLWYKMREGKKLMLPENKDTGKALTEAQVQQLLLACRRSSLRALYPMVMISIFTGVRSCEMKRLTWEQVDLGERPSIRVGKSKTKAGQGRVVYLTPRALNLIKDWKLNFPDAVPSHFVFPSEKLYKHDGIIRTSPDKPYTSFWRAWDKVRRSVGIQCRWHDLRHTAASILGKSGASKAARKATLGWMSDKMMDVYEHSFQEEQQLAILSIDTFMTGVLGDDQPEKESIQ